MHGVAVEYIHSSHARPDASTRLAYYNAMVCQVGYRRHLSLMADAWRRTIDLFLFADPDAALIALASDTWRACVAAHPACHAADPALLIRESDWGEVVLLRGRAGTTQGGQSCWRDHLNRVAPVTELW